MAVPIPTPVRPPLALPVGSVRAILALVLCGSLWYLVLKDFSPLPVLVDSALLVVAFYFGVRSTAPPSAPVVPTSVPVKQPLHLPRGTIRGILLFGFFSVIASLWIKNRPLDANFILILQVLGSYLVGLVINQLVEWRRRSGKGAIRAIVIWRDLNALAAIALTLYICGVLVRVWAELLPPAYQPYTTNALAWVTAYYFGSRTTP